jgi:hypothetical protein
MSEMEDFKRPDHNDFATSFELRKRKFSGIRHNSISDHMEIWLEGDLRFSMSVVEIRTNQKKFDAAYANIFGLHSATMAPLPNKGH